MGQIWKVAMSAQWPIPSWPLWFCPQTNTSPPSVQHKTTEQIALIKQVGSSEATTARNKKVQQYLLRVGSQKRKLYKH